MARVFNQNRIVNAKLGAVDIDRLGSSFAIQYGLDGFSKVNITVEQPPTDVKEFLEGNTLRTQYAVASDVDNLVDYVFSAFPNLEEIYLFNTDGVTLGSNAFTGLSELEKIYVPEDLLNDYKTNYPQLASLFTGIVQDYILNIPHIEGQSTTLTTQYVNEVIAMLSEGQKASITKVVIDSAFEIESVVLVLKNYDFSVLPILNNNIWYGETYVYGVVDFATDSWTQIKLALYLYEPIPYSLGDTKPITYNGNTYNIRIVDISERYDLSNGNGKNKIVCDFEEILASGRLNDTNTNQGGWDSTEMHTTVLPAIYNDLPSDLKAVISQVSVASASDGSTSGSGSLSYSDNHLFFPTGFEVCGRDGSGNSIEQTSMYGYFAVPGGMNRLKYLSGNRVKWWTRSPSAGNNTSFVLINTSAINNDISNAAESNYYSPFFCL